MRPARLVAVVCPLAVMLLAAARPGALDLGSLLAKSGYSPDQKQAIQSIFSQADQQHVPREILLPRLAEGIAKGVGFQRTAEVLEAWLQSLEKARSALQDGPGAAALLSDPAAWSMSATLLETGASTEELRMLENAAQGRSTAYRMAGFLHASLVSWGLSRPLSLQVVLAALRSSLPPQQYLGLVDVFQEGRRLRIAPDRLSQRVIDALGAARDMDDLKRSVLY